MSLKHSTGSRVYGGPPRVVRVLPRCLGSRFGSHPQWFESHPRWLRDADEPRVLAPPNKSGLAWLDALGGLRAADSFPCSITVWLQVRILPGPPGSLLFTERS